MKIAQVAPLYEAVPPKLYGGTERIVAYLTDALVELGHEVTLFASAEAQNPRGTRGGARSGDPARSGAPEIRSRRASVDAARSPQAEARVRRHPLPHRPDPFSFFRGHRRATVTTLHGRLDLKDLPEATGAGRNSRWSRSPTTSAGRLPAPTGARPCITVSTAERFSAHRAEPKADYLAFLGRISPEKRPDRAIEIARRAGHAAADRRQGRQRSTAPISTTRSSRCSTTRWSTSSARSATTQKSRLPRQRRRAAVPDRLAGAVRPGDDRGDGLRHAGDRLGLRLGARGGRCTA